MERKRSLGIVLILTFLFVLVVTAILTGCSNDDLVVAPPDAANGISFRLQNNLPALRATGTTTDNVNAFVVNARDQRDPDEAPNAVIFDGQTVYRLEGAANAFDYNPKKYYPNESEKAYYTAYSPVTKNVSSGLKGSVTNEITYEVPEPDGKYGTTRQEDFLVAATEVIGDSHTPGEPPADRGGFDKSVPLNFKHALSRVYVKASNANVEPVTITAISLNNLYNKGRLDLDGDTWSDESDFDFSPDSWQVDINATYNKSTFDATTKYKVLWDFRGETQNKTYNYVLPPSGIVVAAHTANKAEMVVSKEQGMLILPQTTVNKNKDAAVDDGDFFLEVSYKLSNIENTIRSVFTDINNIASEDNIGLTFEFGKQYALGIEFIGTAINFTIEVEDWNEPPVDVLAETLVKFDGNAPVNASHDVQDVQADITFLNGQPLPTLNDPKAPSLTGWTFEGYFDAPTGGTKYYEANGEAVSDMNWDKTGPYHTLYAHWTATTGTITVTANGADGSSDITSISNIDWVFDTRLPDLSTIPTSRGYIFAGLFTADEGGTQVYDPQGHTTAYYTATNQYGGALYAQWAPKQFTVTIDLNGGKFENNDTGSITFAQTFYAAPAFTTFDGKFSKAGKTFIGLATSYTETSGNVCTYSTGSATWQTGYTNNWTVTDSDTRIYAIWEDE